MNYQELCDDHLLEYQLRAWEILKADAPELQKFDHYQEAIDSGEVEWDVGGEVADLASELIEEDADEN